MSVLGIRPLVLERDTDFTPIVYTWYPTGTSQTVSDGTAVPQDLTGYSCSMMVRIGTEDAAPVATYTPTLGNALGTITISFTNAQVNALYALLPVTGVSGASGFYDVRLTSPGGVKTRFISVSPLTIGPAVTH